MPKKFTYVLIFQLLAYWQVWIWYFQRLSTSSEEIYGLLAILAIGLFCIKSENTTVKPTFSMVLSAIFVFVYLITYPFFPPLLRAVIAVSGLTATLSIWRFGTIFHLGIWSLFLLSLPIIASLQFYLGYPLRVVVGEATAFLLTINGLEVWRDGVSLNFGDKIIWIDAPCSGVKMLWAGFFLSGILVCFYKFQHLQIILAFCGSFIIILAGNIFRAMGLFLFGI